MFFKDKIASAKNTYKASIDVGTLDKTAEELLEIINSPTAYTDFKMQAQGLWYLVRAKVLALTYLGCDYSEQTYYEIAPILNESCMVLRSLPYPNTLRIYEALTMSFAEINDFMKDALELVVQFRDYAGNPTTTSIELLEDMRARFRIKRERAESIPDIASLFAPAVMSDIKAKVVEDIEEVLNWLDVNIKAIGARRADDFFREHVVELDEVVRGWPMSYMPAIDRQKVTTAKTIVVCSPLKDEIYLYAKASADRMGERLLIVDSLGFGDKDNDFIDVVFDALALRGVGCVFTSLTDFRAHNRNYLLEAIVRYSMKGHTVFPVDNKGNRELYNDFYELCKEKDGLTGLDVSYEFLRMPSYAEVSSIIDDRDILPPDKIPPLREIMPFMGYLGLNQLLFLSSQGKKWHDEIADLSDRNRVASQLYMRNIPAIEQFISADWNLPEVERNVVRRKKDFDYDTVRAANPNNIKKILESNISLFAKCGMITRYCTLCGDDVSIWATLDAYEKTKRLCDATRLVAHLLELEYDPEVQVVPVEEWTVKGAGGLCCDGGKKILYREDCVNNYEWTIDAICHECFHAFQQTLMDMGWQNWHYDELGVTLGRVDVWNYNNSNYRDITKGNTVYMIQIIESDARAFASDCCKQSEAIYNTLGLE